MFRSSQPPMRRRDLLRRAGILSAGLFAVSLAACNQAKPAGSPTAAPAKPTAAPAKPTTAPAKPTATTATKPAATQAPPKPQTIDKAKITTIAGVAEYAITFIGADKGVYKDQGIDPEFVGLKDGGTQLKALISGEVDVILGGSGAVFPAQAEGAEIALIGGAYPKLNFVMYAKPGTKDVKELEGKSVGSASPGSFLYIIANALLREKGVDTSTIQFVNIGSSPTVFQAVAAGKVDAGPSSIDFIPLAEKDHNPVVIADFAKELPDYLRVVVVARSKDIKDRPEFVQKVLNGLTMSARYGLDHKDEVVKYGVETMGKQQAQMEYLWKYDHDNKIVAPDAELEPKWVEYTQKVNVDAGLQKQVLPFDRTSTLQFQKAFVEQFGKYNWKM